MATVTPSGKQAPVKQRSGSSRANRPRDDGAAIPSAKPSRRTQEERSAESTQRLLESAVALIAEKGFERTTAVEIGERAGYSRSMVRAKYGTKEGLLESLLRSEFEKRMLQPPPVEVDGLEQVLSQIDLVRSQALKDPETLRAFFVLSFETVGPLASLRPWMIEWLGRYEAQTTAAFREGQRDGSVRADIDPEAEARQIIAYGLGIAFRWSLDPDVVDFPADVLDWRERLRVGLGTKSKAAPRKRRRRG